MDIKSPQNPLNQILFGPPGTGKTYNTVNMALDIVCPIEGSQWGKNQGITQEMNIKNAEGWADCVRHFPPVDEL